MLQSLFIGHSGAIRSALTRAVTTRMLLSSPELLDQITPLISTATTTELSNVVVASATSLSDIFSHMDYSKYWFMFPTCICVAICSISSGIGGAALFGPIFLIVFPALGSQYMLESPAAAVGKYLSFYN
jgi:hypothetical protein